MKRRATDHKRGSLHWKEFSASQMGAKRRAVRMGMRGGMRRAVPHESSHQPTPKRRAFEPIE